MTFGDAVRLKISDQYDPAFFGAYGTIIDKEPWGFNRYLVHLEPAVIINDTEIKSIWVNKQTLEVIL